MSTYPSPQSATSAQNPSDVAQLATRLAAAEAQVAKLTKALNQLTTDKGLQHGPQDAVLITESSLQAKLGVRDEIVLKKVDTRI
jgi:hypothetical protein